MAGLAALILGWGALVFVLVGGKEAMQDALLEQWGVVKIDSLHCNPWGGLCAKGVTVETVEMPDAALSLHIPRITANVRFLPLFTGRVVVRRLVFHEPSLIVAQGELTPLPQESLEEPQILQQEPLEPAPSPEEAVIPGLDSPPVLKQKRNAEFQVMSVRLQNGSFRLTDRQGQTAVLVEGVTLDCKDLETLCGTLRIDRVTWQNGAKLEALEAPFHQENWTTVFPVLKARMAGGTVQGNGTVQFEPNGPIFTLELLADSVKLNQFVPDQQATGALHGKLQLRGDTNDMRTFRGSGQFHLRNGRLEQIPFLQMLGQALSIEELSNLELQKAELDLRADEGKIFVDRLIMESPNLRLHAQGTTEWDGTLALNARLGANAKIRRQLPGFVEANFRPITANDDYREVPFIINGTLEHPCTDLMEVLMGRKVLDQLQSLWKSLNAKPKKTNTEDTLDITPEN